ncbi:MAG: hypothetical protein HC888_12675 [Candidatus Competibacteraceae bacterium]|nr:hypothetical protein [Candidatus Competibacteraceae bacterium]
MNSLSFFQSAFLQTPWFWFLGLLLPVIVIFYLLKLKRRRVLIPSTLLWRRSVQDLIANSPFQKLRNNLLMWLQLLLLLALIIGFMRPVAKLENLGGQTVIFLVDNSASMQTVEPDGQTRLQKAKEARATRSTRCRTATKPSSSRSATARISCRR